MRRKGSEGKGEVKGAKGSVGKKKREKGRGRNGGKGQGRAGMVREREREKTWSKETK